MRLVDQSISTDGYGLEIRTGSVDSDGVTIRCGEQTVVMHVDDAIGMAVDILKVASPEKLRSP